MKYSNLFILLTGSLITSSSLVGEDWPIWGKDQSRNMVSHEKGILFEFLPGEIDENEKVDLTTTKNVKWVAKLGSQAYGNVTIGEGKVLVGTNNESARDRKKRGTGEW